jgi:invasion protein IalB
VRPFRQSRPAFTGLAFVFLLRLHAGAQSDAENLLRSQQTWHIDCMPRGCIASVDILRGVSDISTPDPHDLNQYVSIAVAVERTTVKPSMLTFEVDPKADSESGVDLVFARTVQDGKGWKMVFDPYGPIHFAFRRCDETTCTAAVGGGTPDENTLKACADLVAKMQSEDHLFISYSRAGRSYRTAVSLALFKEAYQHLLAQSSAPVEGPATP